jgi:hypothetical protein
MSYGYTYFNDKGYKSDITHSYTCLDLHELNNAYPFTLWDNFDLIWNLTALLKKSACEHFQE